jgi:hypothetical protein
VRPDLASRLGRAFPAQLRAELQDAFGILPDSRPDPIGTVGPIRLQGEALDIPSRVYVPEPTDVGALGATGEAIVACIYSRHHDGFVREKQVPHLLASNAPWVAPFVVQLIGEYVVEILELLAAHADRLETAPYRDFVAENPQFLSLTRRRMISYWNCYYRQRSPRLADHVGNRLIEALARSRPSVTGQVEAPFNNKMQQTRQG